MDNTFLTIRKVNDDGDMISEDIYKLTDIRILPTSESIKENEIFLTHTPYEPPIDFKLKWKWVR